MSGTGKSTALAELSRRGHRVVDTDDPGWIVPAEAPDGVEPMWDIGRIRALVDGHHNGCLFVSGCVANQGAVYDRFDAVVLLSAPVEVISLAWSTGPTGSVRAQRTARRSPATWPSSSRGCAGADQEIVTTAPVAEVVAALERVAAAAGARAGRSQ